MTKIGYSTITVLSLVALAIPGGASASPAHNHAAKRHMSAHAAAPMIVPAALSNAYDLGTQTAIMIQDNHHGEGLN